METFTVLGKKDSAVDTPVEPPQTLHWVVDEHGELEAELNAIADTAPEFTRGLIDKVVKCIEQL